jgi:hypothetical protein
MALWDRKERSEVESAHTQLGKSAAARAGSAMSGSIVGAVRAGGSAVCGADPLSPELLELVRILARAAMRPKLPSDPAPSQNPTA